MLTKQLQVITYLLRAQTLFVIAELLQTGCGARLFADLCANGTLSDWTPQSTTDTMRTIKIDQSISNKFEEHFKLSSAAQARVVSPDSVHGCLLCKPI